MSMLILRPGWQYFVDNQVAPEQHEPVANWRNVTVVRFQQAVVQPDFATI